MSEQKNNHSTENKAPPPYTPAVYGQQGYYDGGQQWASYNYGPPVPTGYPPMMHPPTMHPPGFQPEPCWPNPGLVPTAPPPAMAYPQPHPPAGYPFPEAPNIVSQQVVSIAQHHHPVQMEEPKDYMAWSIFSLLCCNFMCGVPAIIFSCLVASNRHAPEAKPYSKTALWLNIISLSLGVITWGCGIILVSISFTKPFH
uniref:Uncharacterized protein n=1 Tax=Eptatretus burgeri TaxID=7764 RepID=A0A8C4R6S6_EPTBU